MKIFKLLTEHELAGICGGEGGREMLFGQAVLTAGDGEAQLLPHEIPLTAIANSPALEPFSRPRL